MDTFELIKKRRTIRKFKQDRIDRKLLERMIDAARCAPSANNLQPIKYVIADEPDIVKSIFNYVRWAGYIAPAGNPAEDERPVAYIVILLDTEVKKDYYELDIGAAAQNIFLTALEKDIGSCWMGAIDKVKIHKLLDISDKYMINTVIALGYSSESPIMEDESGSVKYYKDENGVLHVPKRKLQDIILK
jgi:nitroreductase